MSAPIYKASEKISEKIATWADYDGPSIHKETHKHMTVPLYSPFPNLNQ